MTESVVEKVLQHYGIPGMKWGIRRDRGPGGTVGETVSKKETKRIEKNTRKALGGKDPSKLSDKDLSDLVNRLGLEKRLRELQPPPSQGIITRGRKFATDVILDVGSTEIRRVSKAAASVAVERALQKQALRGLKDDEGNLIPFGRDVATRLIGGGGKKKKK